MASKEPRNVFPGRIVLTAGGAAEPFDGMWDARELTAQRPSRPSLVRNMSIVPGGGGRAYAGRPGFTAMGSAFSANVQAIRTWYRPSAVSLTVGVAGGELYRYTSGAWVKVVTTAQLAGAAIALSSAARIGMCPFGAGLVFWDGVNEAFSWTGADGGGLTKLTAACIPLWCWVKSAKLVMINVANRLEIQWSEENQVNLGYATGGYSNAWQLSQITNAPLTAGVGTNEAMIMFRERSCFSITGEIGPDFATASTRNDLADDIGTNAPWSVRVVQDGVVFVDAAARPQIAVVGGGVRPLWQGCVETTSPTLVPRNVVSRAWTDEDRASGKLLMALPSSVSTQLTTLLVYDINTMVFEGVWDGFPCDTIGSVVTDTQDPRFVHSDGVNAYQHGAPVVGPWNDVFRASEAAVAHELTTAVLGRDLTSELFVDTVEVGLMASEVTSITVTGKTTRGNLPSLVVPVASSGGARIGSFIIGTDRLAGVSIDRRAMVGQDGLGRGVSVTVRHQQLGEPCAITEVRVIGYLDGADPDVL